MAIIDPEGLFSGDRLAACSDQAQLLWPRLFIAANSCARLELSYTSIISKIFKHFRKPPKADELWAIFEEYDKNCLAILYQANGTWWCQFITSEKYLPKYKRTRDNLTPAPPPDALDVHRFGYLEWKKANSFSSNTFRKFAKVSDGKGREGVGVGIGVGEESTSAQSSNELNANAPPIGTLPCVGTQKTWPLYQAKVDEWQTAYPGVDVKAELREAKQWLIDNPAKRKTYDGMTRFLSKWLASEQDKPKGNNNGKVGSNHQGAGERVIRGVDAARAAARASAEAANWGAASEHGGSVSTPGHGGVCADVPASVGGPGGGVRDGTASEGTRVVVGEAEVFPPSSRSARGA